MYYKAKNHSGSYFRSLLFQFNTFQLKIWIAQWDEFNNRTHWVHRQTSESILVEPKLKTFLPVDLPYPEVPAHMTHDETGKKLEPQHYKNSETDSSSISEFALSDEELSINESFYDEESSSSLKDCDGRSDLIKLFLIHQVELKQKPY